MAATSCRGRASQPHLVVFITDGDPNEVVREDRVTYDPGNPTLAQNEYELEGAARRATRRRTRTRTPPRRAVPNANALKAQGSHILTVAVGSRTRAARSRSRASSPSPARTSSAARAPSTSSTDDVYRGAELRRSRGRDARGRVPALRAFGERAEAASITIPTRRSTTCSPPQGWSMTATASPPPATGCCRRAPRARRPRARPAPTASSTSSGPPRRPSARPSRSTEVVQAGYFNDPSATKCTYRTPDFPNDRPLPGFSATNGGFTGTSRTRRS